MNELNVFFMLPVSGFGGAEIHSLELAKKLKEKKCNITCCFNYSEENKKLFIDSYDSGFSLFNIPIHNFEHRDINGSVNRQSSISYEFLKDKKIDLVIVPAPNPFMPLGIIEACKKLKIPHIVIFHLVRMNTNVSDSIRTRYLNSISKYTKLVCVSDFCKDALAYNFKIDPDTIQVIENGVELEESPYTFKNLKESLGVTNKRLIITPGRFHPQKSWDTFIEAVPKVIEENDDVHFLWCGNGDMALELKQRAKELQIDSYISIVGFVKAPYNLYPYCDLAVLPTRFEAFSLRLLEAMSSSIPLITTDASYQDRIIINRQSGLVVKTDSIDSLAEAINYALENTAEMRCMAEKAKELSLLYTPQRMYEAYYELVSSLSSKKAISVDESLLTVDIDLENLEMSVDGNIQNVTELFTFGNGKPLGEYSGKAKLTLISKDCRSLVRIFSSTAENGLYLDILKEISSSYLGEKSVVSKFFQVAFESFPKDSITSQNSIDILFSAILMDGGVESSLFKLLMNNLAVFSRNARAQIVNNFCTLKMLDASKNSEFFNFIKKIELNSDLSDFYQSGAHLYYSYIGKPEYAKFLYPAKSEKKTVVLFASHFNFPLRNGSDQRIFSFLEKYASQEYKIVLVVFHRNGDSDRRIISGLKSNFDCDVKIIYQDKLQRDRFEGAFHSIKDGKFDVHKFYDERLLLEFYNVCSVYKPQIIHINYFYFGWLSLAVQPSSEVKLVLDTHDLISKRRAVFDKLKSICGVIPNKTSQVNLERILDSSIGALDYIMDDAEVECYNAFDEVIFISKLELSILYEKLPGTVCEFIPFKPKYNPIVSELLSKKTHKRALFMGSNNALNVMGASLIEKVSERISRLHDFEFRVIGDICNAIPDTPGISKGYFVDDLLEEYIKCDFTVCPIPFGTGQNIKITESLAYGVPVVAHSGVAYSASIVNGVNGLVFSTLQEFYEILVNLSTDELYLERLKKSCREWAVSYFGE